MPTCDLEWGSDSRLQWHNGSSIYLGPGDWPCYRHGSKGLEALRVCSFRLPHTMATTLVQFSAAEAEVLQMYSISAGPRAHRADTIPIAKAR